MDISIKTVDKLERVIKCVLPADSVQSQFGKRLASAGKKAKLAGFRPGKVPTEVMRKNYGASIFQETVSDLIENACRKAITDNNLKPVAAPQIENIKAEPGSDLEFSAKVEVFPEFEPKLLDKITVKRMLASVTDKDVDEMVMQLRRSKAQWEKVDREVQEGDRVKFEFSDEKYAKQFKVQTPDHTMTVVVAASHLAGDLDSQLSGGQIGKKMDLKVTFPKSHADEKYAGKKKKIKVTVRQIEKCLLPDLDQKFFDEYEIGEGGIEKLKTTLREGMELRLKDRIKQRLEETVINAMVKRNNIAIPKALVDSEVQRMKKKMADEMKLPEDQHDQLKNELFVETAKRNVHFSLIMDKYIEKQKIQISDAAIEEKLNEITAVYDDPEAIKNYYRGDPNARNHLNLVLLQEQFMQQILASAKIQDSQCQFHEVMA